MRASRTSPTIVIDTNRIVDWDTFHSIFAEVCGFPKSYARTMSAWADCMTYLDDLDSRMTSIHCNIDEVVTIKLTAARSFATRCPEQYEALLECVAFVNWRRMEQGHPAVLTLAFYKHA